MLKAMSENHTVELQVYIEAGCAQCERAVQLAQEVDDDYSQLAVRLIDIGDAAPRPDEVFAVPTFMLNGRVFSLGNPRQSQLREEIEALLRKQYGVH